MPAIELVACACGCGLTLSSRDSRGRARHTINGHQARILAKSKKTSYAPPKTKHCGGCKDKRPASAFRLRRVQMTTGEVLWRLAARCRDCENKYAKHYGKTEKGRRYKQAHRDRHKDDIRHFVQERISQWRKKPGPPSDLTVDALVALFHEQDGCCYYTGEKMIFNARAGRPLDNSLSLDRLDPVLGYVQGNVAWCSYLANTMKQAMSEATFYTKLHQILSHCSQ